MKPQRITVKLIHLLCIVLALLVACQQADEEPASPSPLPEQDEGVMSSTAAPPAAAQQIARSSSYIPPNDPRIRYTGRFDFSDTDRPAFDWPAVTIEAAFEGPRLAVLLQDGQNLYNVYIDGVQTVLHTRPDETRYVVAEGLGEGSHQVRIVKRTETFYGTPQFLGFELADGLDLASLPPAPQRRIEFIGDSITAGYGSEGQSPTCTFTKETENAELTYATMTAEELDASYIILAISGLGMVRNYNTDEKMSTGTMLSYYEMTTTDPGAREWDFTRWVPQAVVINLGTNDFSTTPHPEGEVFLQGYTEMIVKVRNRYPEAHIFAVAGPIMVDPAAPTIRSVVAQMREVLQDERVHLVNIEDNLELSAVDYGCDWHPNASGHRKIAEQLIPRIREELNW